MEKQKFTQEQIDLIKTMSEQHRYIMICYYVENYSIGRISQLAQMPVDNVKYIISHFTKRILSKLTSDDSESL